MLEAYSLNVTVPASNAVPFNNITLAKGCTAKLVSPTTVDLNKCGVYMIAVNASSATAATIQLSKNGVLQPQAQSTGTASSFVTLVQVTENNSCCPCSSATTISIVNPTEASETFTDVNMVITKVI